MRAAILGGGLTGLTLGLLLKQKKVDFEILEKESTCGGLMQSIQENNFTFDCGGSHIIFSKDKNVLNFMLRVLGDNKIKNKRNTKILYKGEYVKYPFENGLSDLSREENFSCLYHFILNWAKKEKSEIESPKNLKAWCYYTFGNAIADNYLIPYNEKIWKFPSDKMGVDWVMRIPSPPIDDVIKSSLGIETEGYRHQLEFYYPKYGGIQSIIMSLENQLYGNIKTNFDIKKIYKKSEKWVIQNGEIETEYDIIMSTIPIQELIKAINAPKEIQEISNNLKYNSLITVMIGLNKPKINDYSWLYIPDKNILAHRVSFPSNFSSFVAPKDKSSILAEITCNFLDEIWRMDDIDLLDRVVDQLNNLKLINKDEICYQNVRRLKYAYVICDENYNKNKMLIKEYFEKIGISLVGRFSEFEYLNMDDCISHAMIVADKIEV